jgi:predicted  nucleic acid-binding Zn-ribbon protein
MTKQNPYWFFEKWGINQQVPIESLSDKIDQLEERIKLLEDANVEQTNALYEAWNSLDARIDILIEKIRGIGDV